MEKHFNGSDSLTENLSRKMLNINETLKISSEHVNATVALLVKADAHSAMSSMFTTWIVVGSLVIIGVFLAFGLDRMHRNRGKMHAYSSVATIKSPSEIEMEVLTVPTTTTRPASISGQLRMAQEITGRLLVLYAYESHAQFLLVKHLVDLLRQTLPNWELVFYEEQAKDISVYNGLVKWVRDEVYSANRIIFVGSERARRLYLPLNTTIGHGDINSVFSIAWNCVLNDENLRGNYLNIFNVRFEIGEISLDRTSLKTGMPGCHFVLPVDYLQLVKHILGNSSLAETFCRDLKTRLDELQSYQLLEAAVEWMSNDITSRGGERHDITPPAGRNHDLSWILNG